MQKQNNIRIAILDKDKCQSKGCSYLCQKVCPLVRMQEDAITIDEKQKIPIINESLCTGCGICVNKCPKKAIQIINIGINFAEIMHQYGKNQFRLYSLPTIEKGFITGIIGQNGSGKTTALNILSGNLNANFGDYNTDGTIEKTIEYFRGKNIQNHFLDLKNKTAKISYKIQKIEDIPKMFDKEIIELLKLISNDETKLNTIIKELELESLINKKPSQVSGGELQRIAIAASLLKDSNIFFFDEFTTFLDIRQRFKIAKLLQEKNTKDNAILLIEHDLAILDYLSDFVHILYGKARAYGAASTKKTTKKGINDFLSGFLKEENIRIRDYEIKLVSIKEDGNLDKQDLLVEYPFLEKTLGNFKLKINSDKIYKSEVIGILGPNAIGKTTFIKLLAGEINADNTTIENKLKIAYKPQYISYNEDLFVEDLFRQKDIDYDLFESEFKKQFNIDSLFGQKISEISGGELQKIAIAHTLCKNADLYLIDEPSAFLDVEQRLIVSNTIKRIINKKSSACLIVDHDLLLLDYISNRILLFNGEPSKNGEAKEITTISNAFNNFLKLQDITFRQDPETKRPRANKLNSQKDIEQKKENKYYYTI
ncbi:MAG: ribosome biogenesis/translation initiation ATPase RLI [archaeon]